MSGWGGIWRLTELQGQVRQVLQAIDAASGQALSQGAQAAWSAWADLLDAPLGAAGASIAAILPIVDPRQLMAMQELHSLPDDRHNGRNHEQDLGVDRGWPARALTTIRTEIGRSIPRRHRCASPRRCIPAGAEAAMVASGKIYSQPEHSAIDGQIRDIDQPFDVGGVKLMFPRDPAGPPGETINCGCASLPYMASWAASTPGQKPFSNNELAGSPTKRALRSLD